MSDTIRIIIGNQWACDYKLYSTNALRRYDYDGCINVYGDDDSGERWVLIETGNLLAQQRRYRSGGYTSEQMEINQAWIGEILYCRLLEREPGV
jgi:hypothetical protein